MRQKVYWRVLWTAVRAASDYAAVGGRKQRALRIFPPDSVLDGLPCGLQWQAHWSSDFVSIRAYAAAPLNKSSKGVQKGNSKSTPEPEVDTRRINRAIVARHIRLVSQDGESHEILTRNEALLRALRAGLDIVEVDGKSDPVVCKLMDYKKEKFKEKQRVKELRKKQVEKRRLDEVKEVRYGFKIEQKDLEFKAETATRLLQRGHRVKVIILLQGESGGVDPLQQLQKMITLLEGVSKIEMGPRLDTHRAWVLLRPLVPKTSKSESKSGGDASSSTTARRNRDGDDDSLGLDEFEGDDTENENNLQRERS